MHRARLGDVTGKILVDPTNLLNADWSDAGDIQRSGAEELAGWAKGAHVVKAFNTVFAQNMSTGRVGGEALDVGPLAHARSLEALGFLNIQLGCGPTQYGTALGFKVVGAPRASD